MGHGITAQNATAIVALIAVFSATGCVCQLAPAPLEKNTLRVCVVERAPFSLCSVSKASPQEWPKSYQVDLFKRIVDDLDDESVKAAFQPNWQCVGRTTAELIAELGRPQGSRSCDIAIAPITINEERKLTIDFITGVHFTFSVPIAAADDLGVGNEMAFWLKPFKAEAWWANLGILFAFALTGGLLASFLDNYWQPVPRNQQKTSTINKLAIRSAGSIVSVFGQHPSHGVLGRGTLESGQGDGDGASSTQNRRASEVLLAIFFAAGVFAIAIISMQYAGNLAAIQGTPTVIPTLVDLADLYGLTVLSNGIYADALPVDVTLVNATISNNDDVLKHIRMVDEAKVDAFLWDADIALHALSQIEANKEPICVKAMRKRVFPFELGYGLGKDLAPQVRESLQRSLDSLKEAGVQREFRQEFLTGLRKYMTTTVCPGASQGLTLGQVTGVYVIPALVFGMVLVWSLTIIAYRKWKSHRQGRIAQRPLNVGTIASGSNDYPVAKI